LSFAFRHLVLTYNAIVYPICILTLLGLIVPLRRARLRLIRAAPPSAEEIAAARRRALQLPWWIVYCSCLGWLPGGSVRIGLTSGASTPDNLVDTVVRRLDELANQV